MMKKCAQVKAKAWKRMTGMTKYMDIKPRPRDNYEEVAQRLNWLTAYLVREKGKQIQVNKPHEWAHLESWANRAHNLREPHEEFVL